MRRGRRTLAGMDPAQLDRIRVHVLDAIVEQGGDWGAVEAIIRHEYFGDALEIAYGYADAYLHAYTEPGGPAFLRGMRDRRRRLIPAQPAGRRWGWKATG